MKKRFNVTGPCNPKYHYMVNIDSKLKVIENMIDRGDYFVINRPRQYGKTTVLSQLSKRLNESYLIIRTSFEGIGDKIFQCEETFSSKILGIFAEALEYIDQEKAAELRNLGNGLTDLFEVSKAITQFIKNCEREVVLLIDEVDKASNNQLFLSFLGMLRNKYIMANDELDYTFHSVVLAGVHDIKNLKLKLRAEDEKKYNSPWNIAVNFNLNMNFTPQEIETMVKEYSNDNNIIMDIKAISEGIYFYTNGYPFLVSRLCQIIDENLLGEDKKAWTIEHIDKAVKIILRENNTLFDDLIKNLENNKDLYELVKDIVLDGNVISFNIANPIVSIGHIYGIFKEEDYRVKLNNRIYEQFIYDYLISKLEVKSDKLSIYNYKNNFITSDNRLDFEKILLRYQQFMKEQYSSIDSNFIEREGRLLFLAFIKPIVNGVGFDFKEVQIAEEKRLDVVVTYNQSKYVIELKIWRGSEYHKKGIEQLSEYLDIQGLSKGYLVVYSFNKNKEYKQETINLNGKEIFVVYV